MTLERAIELLKTQIDLGSGYNRNSAKLILAEVQRIHGQAAVDNLINKLDLEQHFGFRAGEKITR